MSPFLPTTCSLLQAVVDGKARVWLTSLSRDLGPGALLQLVKGKVDLDLSGSERIRISSTGTGSNFWQPEIESQLNIKLVDSQCGYYSLICEISFFFFHFFHITLSLSIRPIYYDYPKRKTIASISQVHIRNANFVQYFPWCVVDA